MESFWNQKRSTALTKICVWVLLAVSVLMLVTGPYLAANYLKFSGPGRAVEAGILSNALSYPLLLFLSYLCGIAFVWMLLVMLRFLDRISKGEIFTDTSVRSLRQISHCCLAGAVLTMIIGLCYSLFFLIICAASVFMMLIVRVVQNVFAQAVLMKDELDLTI